MKEQTEEQKAISEEKKESETAPRAPEDVSASEADDTKASEVNVHVFLALSQHFG